MVTSRQMSIAAIFLHSFYIVVKGALCHSSTFADFLQKSETDSKKRPIFFKDYYVLGTKNGQNRNRFIEKTFFLEIIMFLGQKIDKIETDSKL